MYGLTLTLSDVISFLLNNLSGLKKYIYSGMLTMLNYKFIKKQCQNINVNYLKVRLNI